ncbi:MAG: MBL fold metallo-hydrolase [Calditrichia bacterium]
MSKPHLRVKIYGARGSYSPTSGIASSIGVNTTCLRVDIGNHLLIFDAGSGIIKLGQDLIKEKFSKNNDEKKWKYHLFFTHMHLDHIVGFPYFAMLYMPKTELHFLSPRILDYDLEDVLTTFMHPPFFPVSMEDLPFKKHFYQLAEKTISYFYEDHFELHHVNETPASGWLAKISCMRNYMHPKGGSFFYKIETLEGRKIVFASDTEGYIGGDQKLVGFAKDADLLFHDAQYNPEEYQKNQGFGHSTYEMACDVAIQSGAKELLLFHHDPSHDDDMLRSIEAEAQKVFPNSRIASECMEFEF